MSCARALQIVLIINNVIGLVWELPAQAFQGQLRKIRGAGCGQRPVVRLALAVGRRRRTQAGILYQDK